MAYCEKYVSLLQQQPCQFCLVFFSQLSTVQSLTHKAQLPYQVKELENSMAIPEQALQ